MKIRQYIMGLIVFSYAMPVRDVFGPLMMLPVFFIGLYLSLDGFLKPEFTADQLIKQVVQILATKEDTE